MSDLIAIAYPDEAAAGRARENLHKGVVDGLLQVEDVVTMVRDENGTVDVRQGSTGVGVAAVGGALGGGLIGLMLMAPLFGMAAGALAGGAAWKSAFGDEGVAETFVDGLRESLEPGTAALVILVRELSPDDVLPRLQEPGHVIRTSLSEAMEAHLDAALSAARPDAS